MVETLAVSACELILYLDVCDTITDMDVTGLKQTENEAEFQRCYNDNADNLFRFFLYKVSDRNIALDLLQEDFFKLWKVYASGQQINSCKSWLYHVGTNSVIDWYRRKKNLSLDALTEAHVEFSVSADPIYAEAEQTHLFGLFNQLKAEDRQILTLRFVDALPDSDIARLFSIQTKTVPVKVFRALKRLRILANQHKNKS